VFGGPG